MKERKKRKLAAASRAHYERNKSDPQFMARLQMHRDANRTKEADNTKKRYLELSNQLKIAKGGICASCDETDLRVLQFDHRDRHTKDYDPTRAIRHFGIRHKMESKRICFAEINKCRLLCVRCHFLHTHHGLTIVDRQQDCVLLSPE